MEKREEKSNKTNISYEELLRPMTLTLKVVIIKNDKILLLKRSPEEITNKNKLDLPGGHLDEGETIGEGIKREVFEETGLEVDLGELIKFSEYPKDSEYFDKIKSLRFLAYYRSGEVKLNKEEHSEYFWLPIDEAIGMLEEKGFEGEKRETLILAKQYLEMKNSLDGWRRALADMENYKKRVAKDNEEFRKYCLEDFVLQLLPVLDNFDSAAEHISEEDKKAGWVVGVMHIKNQLESVLKDKGIEAIEVEKGDKLDEKIHEVVSGTGKKGKVKKVLKKGYRMGERIIRPVSVEGE